MASVLSKLNNGNDKDPVRTRDIGHEETLADLRAQVRELAVKTQYYSRETLNASKDIATDGVEEVQHTIRKNPKAAILIAFGTGIVAACLVSPRRQARGFREGPAIGSLARYDISNITNAIESALSRRAIADQLNSSKQTLHSVASNIDAGAQLEKATDSALKVWKMLRSKASLT